MQDNVKAEINAKSKYGETPLLIAIMTQNEHNSELRNQFISFLLENGADPNFCNKFTFWTPMHWAARYGDIVMINKLLENDATPFTPDRKGCFPIDYAGKFDHKETVQKLV